MRIIDKNGVTISESEVDFTKGFLRTDLIIRQDSKPLSENKKVWSNSDYEEVRRYVLFDSMQNEPKNDTSVDDVLNVLLGVTA